VARVNTGRLRRAVLQYDDGHLPKIFSVQGLDYLRSVALQDQQPQIEQTPLVEPAVKFTVPSQRVTTAGGDGGDPGRVPEALAGLRNHLPLLRAIGFNAVESYVRWGWVEHEPGVYDWSYYDALLAEIEKHGLQWFPMLLAGSGYALPAWLYESTNNVGFKCLEHGIAHDTQSIFYPYQAEYSHRFIEEFGKHYGGRASLLGIRLGPSGDYGEAQYPAKGPGYKFREGHTHIGYWAADAYAQGDFRGHLKKKYEAITSLNRAWESGYDSSGQHLPAHNCCHAPQAFGLRGLVYGGHE
jgi:beta-galactosidase GanA